MRQDASGAWLSDDGLWRWDGQQWVPNLAPSWPDARVHFGDAITLPARGAGWAKKLILQGLIGLIPIVGWFQLVGWTMTYLDHLRSGRADLPPPGFGYARRGWNVAWVGFAYFFVIGLVSWIVLIAAAVAGIFGAMPHAARMVVTTAPLPLASVVGILMLEFAFMIVFAAAHFLVVPVILRTDRYGFWAGLNLVAAIQMAFEDLQSSGGTAVLTFLAYFIAGLGFYALVVGYIFSSAYGWAMIASTTLWYEQRRTPAAAPASAPV